MSVPGRPQPVLTPKIHINERRVCRINCRTTHKYRISVMGRFRALAPDFVNDSFGRIVLKNSIIWMEEFSVENQINLNFSYRYVREFVSGFVRTDRD